MLRRRLVAVAVLLVVVGGVGGWWWFTRPTADIVGRVVSAIGDPIAAASVAYSGGGSSTTDADGRFAIPSRVRGGWVTAAAEGFLSRTRAAQDGDETLLRLFAEDGETIRLLFGGDVMFGRRYYDQNDDGDRSDGLLRQGATAEEHRWLLEGIAPVLADADLTIVNLESPLIDDPWVDPNAPRPDRFHPTKEFVFGSAPEAAVALREAGVDIVGLGNNHMYDVLDAGVTSTQRALLDAGYTTTDFVGAGQNVDEAWRPAIRAVRGQRIAVVACTTITGVEHPITYVAGATKGGAAGCEDAALTAAVQTAMADADLVVAMIHGGFEYVREPSNTVAHFSEVANEAGANLVVNHHPHVVGGLESAGDRLTAWTMGNLLFDQTVWPTFGSYVLRVDVRGGKVVNAYLEPIMLRGYRPVGLVGSDADWVSREAQSLSDGSWIVDDGSLTLAPNADVRRTPILLANADPSGPAPVLDLDGACLDGVPNRTMVGRDEAWTGNFEDGTADDAVGGGGLWNLIDANPDRELLPDAAASGDFGVRLSRAGADSQEIVLSPLHRLLVQPGEPVTVLVAARGTSEADARLQMSWYNDTLGPSQQQSVVPLPLAREWQTFRIDFTVPANAVAVGPYLGLAPPQGNEASIDVDDVRVIVWHAAAARSACDYVRLADVGHGRDLTATATSLPGGEALSEPRWIDAVTLTAEAPPPLPPGPTDGGWGNSE